MTLPTIPAIRMERVTVAEEVVAETIQGMHHLEGVTMDAPNMTVDIADVYFRMDCLRAAVQLYQGQGDVVGVNTVKAAADSFMHYIANPEPKE